MKKIILVILLAAVLFIVAGCATKVVDEKGMERETDYGLIVIEKHHNGISGSREIVYDPITKVCYTVIDDTYRAGISPYYIIGEDGKPEIAVYGVNYK